MYDNNVYDNPEKFGLVTVGSADAGEMYEFDIFAIWHDGSQFVWANDTGCSCPSPFESYEGTDGLNKGSKFDVAKAIVDWASASYRENETKASDLIALVFDFTPPDHTPTKDISLVGTVVDAWGDDEDEAAWDRIKTRLTDAG